MSQLTPHWESALEISMMISRDDANWRREHGITAECGRLDREIAFMRGMRYAVLYWADECEETTAARDAFTAAQNELNFLFGRYQERT